MSILSTLGAELKALQKLTGPRDPFARTSSFGLGSSLGSSLVSQSNALDLDRLVSDPLHNGVVAACVNAVARALPDAPLLLEQRNSSGWKIVEDHPCLEVLRSPNPDHSDADVWGLTSGYKATRGQAFWLLLPNSHGEVSEIHVWNPDRVTVLGDEEQFISGYRVQRESGTHFLADKRQIIHFRHLPDFTNPRLGWSPLRTGRAQIAGDNVAASYHTSILFNAGVVSLLVSLKEGAMSGQVTPEQFQTVLTNLRRAGRERAGGIEGINLPLEVHKLAYSPDEMNIDQLIEYYETRICSVMGVSQRVAGLGSDPTYNNLSEALNDFWERRIVPDRNADAATLNRQWLPLWGLNGGSWRFRFDYSNVPALQENRDALHARVRSDWEKGLLDKQQARALLGYATENDGEFARVFYGQKPEASTEDRNSSPLSEVKVWDESQHPRDDDGKFTYGADTGVHNNFEDESDEGIDNVTPTGRAHRTPAERHLLNLILIDQQFSDKPLTDQNMKNFAKSLHYVTSNIPPHLHTHIVSSVRLAFAFNNKQDLCEYVNQTYGKDWKNVPGAWLRDRGHILLNGGKNPWGVNVHHQRNCIQGHELGHVIDTHQGSPISQSKEWLAVYDTKIKGRPNVLTPYAATGGPAEAFAEFSSLMLAFDSFAARSGQIDFSYSDNPASEYCKLFLPECLEVWNKQVLLR